MTLPQSNPLIGYGLRRIEETTRGLKNNDRMIARREKELADSRADNERLRIEREHIMDALGELGVSQDEVEALMDKTADEYDAEWAERSNKPVRKAVPKGMRPE